VEEVKRVKSPLLAAKINTPTSSHRRSGSKEVPPAPLSPPSTTPPSMSRAWSAGSDMTTSSSTSVSTAGKAVGVSGLAAIQREQEQQSAAAATVRPVATRTTSSSSGRKSTIDSSTLSSSVTLSAFFDTPLKAATAAAATAPSPTVLPPRSPSIAPWKPATPINTNGTPTTPPPSLLNVQLEQSRTNAPLPANTSVKSSKSSTTRTPPMVSINAAANARRGSPAIGVSPSPASPPIRGLSSPHVRSSPSPPLPPGSGTLADFMPPPVPAVRSSPKVWALSAATPPPLALSEIQAQQQTPVRGSGRSANNSNGIGSTGSGGASSPIDDMVRYAWGSAALKQPVASIPLTSIQSVQYIHEQEKKDRAVAAKAARQAAVEAAAIAAEQEELEAALAAVAALERSSSTMTVAESIPSSSSSSTSSISPQTAAPAPAIDAVTREKQRLATAKLKAAARQRDAAATASTSAAAVNAAKSVKHQKSKPKHSSINNDGRRQPHGVAPGGLSSPSVNLS
jgi:hypothetical protein